MKSRAHTTGLLFQLDQRNWVCAWCARHHTNLFLYDRYIPTCYKLLYDKKYRDQPILHSYYIISIIISVFKTQIRSSKYCLWNKVIYIEILSYALTSQHLKSPVHNLITETLTCTFSESSMQPYNSIKLSGADVTTDRQSTVFTLSITPLNQEVHLVTIAVIA